MSLSRSQLALSLLIIALMLKSFVAVVSALEIHQYDPTHAQTIHSHLQDLKKPAYQTTIKVDQQDSHNATDCHHCGHCSGSHLHALNSKFAGFFCSLLSRGKSEYIFAIPQALIQDFLRPPIS